MFFIVQTSIDAYESYPDCLETSEGCAPDSPTTDSTVIPDYCRHDSVLHEVSMKLNTVVQESFSKRTCIIKEAGVLF